MVVQFQSGNMDSCPCTPLGIVGSLQCAAGQPSVGPFVVFGTLEPPVMAPDGDLSLGASALGVHVYNPGTNRWTLVRFLSGPKEYGVLTPQMWLDPPLDLTTDRHERYRDARRNDCHRNDRRPHPANPRRTKPIEAEPPDSVLSLSGSKEQKTSFSRAGATPLCSVAHSRLEGWKKQLNLS